MGETIKPATLKCKFCYGGFQHNHISEIQRQYATAWALQRNRRKPIGIPVTQNTSRTKSCRKKCRRAADA